jgi:hypothetical protein
MLCRRFAQRCASKQKISQLAVQQQGACVVNEMAALLTFPAVRRFLVSVATSVLLILPAQAQDFGERSHKPQPPPVESHPRVSEKDYEAALEKIPTPTRKYDPWGVARPGESPKNAAEPPKEQGGGELARRRIYQNAIIRLSAEARCFDHRIDLPISGAPADCFLRYWKIGISMS